MIKFNEDKITMYMYMYMKAMRMFQLPMAMCIDG